MKRWLSIAALIALAGGCEFHCSAGGTGIDKLAELIEGEIGVRPEVSCPELKLNEPVPCTAKLPDGTEFSFTAKATAKELSFSAPDWAPAAKLKKDIEGILKDKHKLEAQRIDCPLMMHVPVDGGGECVAYVREVPVRMQVTQKEGRYFYVPQSGLVVGELAAKAVNEQLASQNQQGRVECPFVTRLSKPGDRFICPLTLPDGERAPVHFVITGVNGTIEFSGEGPPPFDDGPATAPAGQPTQ